MDNSIEYLYSKFLQSTGVSTDTRKINKGDIFFALKGPNFNGNLYAEAALKAGAKFAVVDESVGSGGQYILVSDVLTALQELAKFHRSKFKRPVIGLTGSNGKTTTKELIHAVLSEKYITHATVGNFNNHIGVPLTILAINPQVEIAIIEMGASAVGEIKLLSQIADPSLGLITNIGHAHTETFGGIEGVIRGKSELFDHLRFNEGKVFINSTDEVLNNMAKRFKDPTLYPPEDVTMIESGPLLSYQVGSQQYHTHLIGDYNFPNVAAAISIGRYFDVSEDEIHRAITNYQPTNNRSQVERIGSNQVIQDAYNANPSSMKAALQNLGKIQGYKVAILGDMNELEDPVKEHRQLGTLVKDLELDEVIFCGKLIGEAVQTCPGGKHFTTTDDLIEYLKQHKFEDATILVKASRGLKLERLYDYI